MYEAIFGKKKDIQFTEDNSADTTVREKNSHVTTKMLEKWTGKSDEGQKIAIQKVFTTHDGEIVFNNEKRLHGAVVRDSHYCKNDSDVIVLIKDTAEGREVLNYSKQLIKVKKLNFVKAFVCEINVVDGLYALDAVVSEEEDAEAYAEEDQWIPQYRNDLFSRAVSKGASDIHFELRERLYIKVRIDGFRRPIDSLTYERGVRFMRALHGAFSASDFKKYDSYEEGKTFRIKVDGENRNVRMRFDQSPAQIVSDDEISIDIVLRILSGAESVKKIKSFEELGFDDETAEYFDMISRRKKGIILMLGPTGSGKTTTLHTFFNTYLENCNKTKKIISIEDPPEAIIPGVNIWPLYPKPNDDGSSDSRIKAAVTRMNSAMRHDPDFLAVGEIREKILAKMAYQASRTGHLVSSTLHASRWSDAYTRFINEFNLEPTEVAAYDSIQAIVVQNLVPKLCKRKGCSHSYEDVMNNKDNHNILFNKVQLFVDNWCENDELSLKRLRFMNPNANKECPDCGGTGVVGRVLLYEMFVPEDHPELIELIEEKKFSQALAQWEKKKSEGSKVHGYSLHDRAAEYAMKGVTCLQETIDIMGSNI